MTGINGNLKTSDDVFFVDSFFIKEFQELLDINKITHFCTDMCFIALKRGEQALTLRLLRTIVESKELVTQMNNPQESKASVWNPRTWGR